MEGLVGQPLTMFDRDVHLGDVRSHADVERLVPAVLPWVLEAGSPYFEWLLGGASAARTTIGSWMRRPSSEVSIQRTTIMLHGGSPVGAFIALDPSELRACRAVDALAALRDVDPGERGAFLSRMAEAKRMLPPVDDDHFYLSKMAVASDRRRRGIGRKLVREFLDQGNASRFRQFRLDVHAQNTLAIKLYRSEGFEVVAEGSAADGKIRYIAMTLER
jgi:ribosomal protein S18 acetylase RimI-like enzyme